MARPRAPGALRVGPRTPSGAMAPLGSARPRHRAPTCRLAVSSLRTVLACDPVGLWLPLLVRHVRHCPRGRETAGLGRLDLPVRSLQSSSRTRTVSGQRDRNLGTRSKAHFFAARRHHRAGTRTTTNARTDGRTLPAADDAADQRSGARANPDLFRVLPFVDAASRVTSGRL